MKDWCSKQIEAIQHVLMSLLLALSIVKGLIAGIGYMLLWIRNCSVERRTLHLIRELEVLSL